MIARLRLCTVLLACLFLTTAVLAQDDSAGLATVQGTVDKVEKEGLTVRTRGADGKFGKNLNLKLTGTSKITTLSYQKRAGKMVAVQNDINAKDLEAKQAIAVIYSNGPDGMVLLAAVVQPAAAK
jgi:hypothetical protein